MYTGPQIVRSGLVLCLDAANQRSYLGSGTVWSDLSGNGNTGTLTNGPTFNSENGGSIVFDGVNDYVGLGTPSSLNLTSALTISAFVNISSFVTNTWYTIYEKGYGGPIEQTYFRINNYTNPRTLQVGTYNDSGADRLASVSIDTLSTNTWYNFCGLYDGAAWRLYIDGVFQTSTTTGGPYVQNNPVSVGAAWIVNSYSRIFNGRIANCLVYNRGLTAAEVLQNYNATKSRFGL